MSDDAADAWKQDPVEEPKPQLDAAGRARMCEREKQRRDTVKSMRKVWRDIQALLRL